MIIGISGKQNSSKDTIGKIIQGLVANYSEDEIINSIEEGTNLDWNLLGSSEWEIKKFASKIKDMTCLIIRCSRKDLEDHEFKSCALQDWNKLTPRKILQSLGDWGRTSIHTDIWINALFDDYQETEDYVGGSGHTAYPTYSYPNYIITDIRYVNEIKAIKDRGGIVIRVNRSSKLSKEFSEGVFGENTSSKLKIIDFSEHSSETDLDNFKEFDYVINNDGTIEDLIEKVREILKTENIL